MISSTVTVCVLLSAIVLVKSQSCHTCVEMGKVFIIDAEMRAACYKMEAIKNLEVKFLARTPFECDIIGPIILKGNYFD